MKGQDTTLFEVLVPLVAEIVISVISASYICFSWIIGKTPSAVAVSGEIAIDRTYYSRERPHIICSLCREGEKEEETYDSLDVLDSFMDVLVTLYFRPEDGCLIRFFHIVDLSIKYEEDHKKNIDSYTFREAVKKVKKLEGSGHEKEYYELVNDAKIYPCIHSKDGFYIKMLLHIPNREPNCNMNKIFEKMDDKLYMEMNLYLYNSKGRKKQQTVYLDLEQKLFQNSNNEYFWTTIG